METIKINVSGPVHVGDQVRVIAGKHHGLVGTVTSGDGRTCEVAACRDGHTETLTLPLHLVLRIKAVRR